MEIEKCFKLPIFSGINDQNMSCEHFIFLIEEIGKVNSWNDQDILHYGANCLVNDALHWYSNTKESCRTFLAFKSLMLGPMGPRRAMNLKQKLELKQALFQGEMGETVPEFFKRCKSAQDEFCDNFYSEVLNERELLLNFVNGLKPEIQQSLLENEEIVETLETTLEAAIKIEASFFKTEIDIISSEEQHCLPENELEENGCLQELSFFEEIINEDKYDPLLSDIFKCLQCGFSYTTQKLLDDHTLSEHSPENSKIKCSSCPVTFATKRIFNFHMQQCHPDTCFTCHLCNQILYSSTKYNSHYAKQHEGEVPPPLANGNGNGATFGEFQCRFCSKDYNNKNSLKAHMRTKHLNSRTFSCQVCPKKFTSSSNLKTHTRIVHLMERPYECDECDKSYASEGGLSAHQASIHDKGERLQCDKCDMSFPYKSALTTHILNRHNRGTFICDECGAANNTKEALRVHKITDHSEDKGKKIPCPHAPECKEKFRVPFQVRNHVKRVHKKIEGTYLCSLCPKKYHSRQRLESHINGVHLNKKPHKCPHCDFASAYQGHVKDHIRASHDAVKYPCPYPACNHQSSYKGNLDKHIKNIHANKIETPIENTKAVSHLD